MKSQIHKYFIIIFIIALSTKGYTQTDDEGYYYKYSFENFLTNKTAVDEEYMKEIQRNLKYPRADRENKIEGIVRALIINNDSGDFEIIAANNLSELDEAVIEALEIAHNKYSSPSKEKYITEISVEFKFDDYNDNSEKSTKNKSDIIVTAMPTKYKEQLSHK